MFSKTDAEWAAFIWWFVGHTAPHRRIKYEDKAQLLETREVQLAEKISFCNFCISWETTIFVFISLSLTQHNQLCGNSIWAMDDMQNHGPHGYMISNLYIIGLLVYSEIRQIGYHRSPSLLGLLYQSQMDGLDSKNCNVI